MGPNRLLKSSDSGVAFLGTALPAGVSVASIIVGLAAQNTLGNLVSGVSLLLYRPFRVGDSLQIGASTGLEIGEVERMTLGYTILKTPDGRRIIVPNSAMINQAPIRLASSPDRLFTWRLF